MPISRVRSVTVTSMMFMMPMPPTTRLTPAARVVDGGERGVLAVLDDEIDVAPEHAF